MHPIRVVYETSGTANIIPKTPCILLLLLLLFNSYTTINTPYNWSAFLAASCLNIEYLSLQLVGIRN